MEFWADLAEELMRMKRNKLPFFQRGQAALTEHYPINLLASLSPRQEGYISIVIVLSLVEIRVVLPTFST